MLGREARDAIEQHREVITNPVLPTMVDRGRLRLLRASWRKIDLEAHLTAMRGGSVE